MYEHQFKGQDELKHLLLAQTDCSYLNRNPIRGTGVMQVKAVTGLQPRRSTDFPDDTTQVPFKVHSTIRWAELRMLHTAITAPDQGSVTCQVPTYLPIISHLRSYHVDVSHPNQRNDLESTESWAILPSDLLRIHLGC